MAINVADVYSMLLSEFSAFNEEISLGPDSPLQNYTKNITARTMLSELITIADDALKAALGDGPDNSCTYLYKRGKSIMTDVGASKDFIRKN